MLPFRPLFALALATLTLAGCGAGRSLVATSVASHSLQARALPAPGSLMFIGGGADQDDLMQTWMGLSGGADSPLVIVPLASDDPAKSGAAYVTYLQGLGAKNVHSVIPAGPPAQADLDLLATAGGCFFSGGDQARIFAALTPPWRTALAAAAHHGAVMAGTSAGAMVWGDTAIMGGDPLDTAMHGTDPNFDGLRTGPGLDLAPGWVVDTHFSQRGRVPRLALAVALAPGETGLGVDPETAAVLRPDGTVEVAGRGTVTVIDVPPQGQPVQAPLSLKDLHVSLLRAGDRLAAHNRQQPL